MGQPGDEWALSGGAIGARAPSGPTIAQFPVPALPVDPAPQIPWGEIANPALESLSILLPALNEEDGIADVLNRIPRLTLQQKGYAYSVHLLDGGSTDQTRAVAKRLGAEVFIQSGIGKGSAFREFVPKIRDQYVVLLDSDGTYPPEVIPDIVGKLGAGSPVVIVGPRTALVAATKPSCIAWGTSMRRPVMSPAAKIWGVEVRKYSSTFTNPR